MSTNQGHDDSLAGVHRVAWITGMLQRLDRVLARAVAMARAAEGADSLDIALRGLYITPADVDRLLDRPPASPTFPYAYPANGLDAPVLLVVDTPESGWLQIEFGLQPFDLDIIAISLAIDIDLRYERIFAYLQDDITRRRPTVDLALNLLCPDAATRLSRRVHFGTGAPLIRHDLLRLIPDPSQTQPPLLAHYLKLDDQLIQLLLGQPEIDARIARCCRQIIPDRAFDDVPLDGDTKRGLERLVAGIHADSRPLRLHFTASSGNGQRQVAEALATALGMSLLIVDLARAHDDTEPFEHIMRLAFRHARFQRAVVLLDGSTELPAADRETCRGHVLEALARFPGVSILVGDETWTASGAITREPGTGIYAIPFSHADTSTRFACWQRALTEEGVALPGADVELLATRYRLGIDQISRAAHQASNVAAWRGGTTVGLTDVTNAARRQSGQELAQMARHVVPAYNWPDIVLPPDQMAQLQELCNQSRFRHIVYDAWGAGRHHQLGAGLNALFSGPSGTGKTMAAEVIAAELDLDLYTVDISQMVSKYIGETEKNLDRVFTAARDSNAILFFDEADAIFGKRSPVRDAHDRYANIEVGYLLQKMEQHDGLVILGTNLRTNMDDAFIRRLHHAIEFPFPDASLRLPIWEKHLAPGIPRDDDIDMAFLARQFEVAGGNIRNIVVNGCFLAAADNTPLAMRHLILATRREFQKMGRVCDEDAFGPYFPLIADPAKNGSDA